MMLPRVVRLGCFAGLMGLVPQVGLAAIEFQSDLGLAEIYTSNVDLAAGALEEDEWVTRLAPHVSLNYASPMLELMADYTLEALFYANDSERNQSYNQLDSRVLLDLIGKDLQLRGLGVINQVNVSPERPVANNNLYTTANRTDATTWSLGPQWQRDVFGGSEVSGYATFGEVNYDDPRSQDIDTISGRFSLHTRPRLRPAVSYELTYEYDKLDYLVSGDSVVQTAYLQLGYRLNNSLELFVLGGLDNDIEERLDGALDESRWEAGFDTETGVGRLRAAVGHRYFGPTYSFQWSLTSNDANYRISYREAPTTSDLTRVREIPAAWGTGTGVPPLLPPDSNLGRPGDPLRYISRRGDALGSWHLLRTELSAGLFWENRRDQVLTGPGGVTNVSLYNEESYGFNLGARWEAGPRSVIILGANWRHRDYNDLASAGCDPLNPDPLICQSSSDGDEMTWLTAGLDYAFGQKTSLGFQLSWQRRSGTASEDIEYKEFLGSIQLRRRFF